MWSILTLFSCLESLRLLLVCCVDFRGSMVFRELALLIHSNLQDRFQILNFCLELITISRWNLRAVLRGALIRFQKHLRRDKFWEIALPNLKILFRILKDLCRFQILNLNPKSRLKLPDFYLNLFLSFTYGGVAKLLPKEIRIFFLFRVDWAQQRYSCLLHRIKVA